MLSFIFNNNNNNNNDEGLIYPESLKKWEIPSCCSHKDQILQVVAWVPAEPPKCHKCVQIPFFPTWIWGKKKKKYKIEKFQHSWDTKPGKFRLFWGLCGPSSALRAGPGHHRDPRAREVWGKNKKKIPSFCKYPKFLLLPLLKDWASVSWGFPEPLPGLFFAGFGGQTGNVGAGICLLTGKTPTWDFFFFLELEGSWKVFQLFLACSRGGFLNLLCVSWWEMLDGDKNLQIPFFSPLHFCTSSSLRE